MSVAHARGRQKPVTMTVRLPLHVIRSYKTIARMAGTDIHTVINVLMAMFVLHARRQKQDRKS